MPAYTVYQPPARRYGKADSADRAVFVRDGFYFGAFLFGALWLIWRRLWLVFILYLLAMAGIEYGLRQLGVGTGARIAVMVLVALLIGMEAATLRRWTLLRRGWRECGVVIASDLEMAERRFFDARRVRETARVTPVATAVSSEPESAGAVGLFPEPRSGG